MRQKKCYLCGTVLKDGGPKDPHFKTVRHARQEKSFRHFYGAELTRKLEKLFNRWIRGSSERRK